MRLLKYIMIHVIITQKNEYYIEYNKYNMALIEYPLYLFSTTLKPSNIPADLYELCCDEYYEYIELVDDRIFEYLGPIGKYNLLVFSIKNSSPICFEYIMKKFNIKVDKNFNIILDKDAEITKDNNTIKKLLINEVEYLSMSTKMIEYLVDNYDIINILHGISCYKFLNKDYELIKKINTKRLYIGHFENACIENQLDIVKYFIEEKKLQVDNLFLSNIIKLIFRQKKNIYFNKDNKINTIEYLYNTFNSIFNTEFINKLLEDNECNNIIYFQWLDGKNILLNDKIIFKQFMWLFYKTNEYKKELNYEILYWLYKRIKDKKIIDYEYIYQISIKTFGNNNQVCKYLIDTNMINREKLYIYQQDYFSDYCNYKKIIESRREYVEFHYNKYINNNKNNEISI